MYDIYDLSPLKRQWLLRTSNIPRRFIGLGIEDVIEKTGAFPDDVKNWIDDALSGEIIRQIGNISINGVGLLFDGGPGIGKTTHAVVAAMEFIRRLPDDPEAMAPILRMEPKDISPATRPIYYTTYPEFLSYKKSSFDLEPDEKRELTYKLDGLHGRSKYDHLNTRILVIDDLGKEYGSKYDDSTFDEILRLRYDKGLPTIVTTNVKLENWESTYSEAMQSFAKEAFYRVPIVSGDLRGA